VGCVFCRIAAKEIPADIVYENAEVLAFRDIRPVAPVHVVLIPKIHTSGIRAAVDANIKPGPLVEAAVRVAETEKLGRGGYRLVINQGADGGQTVEHLHLHLLGGRPMSWPPG